MKHKIVALLFCTFLLPFSSFASMNAPADKAFTLALEAKPTHIVAHWTIAPGTYLYQAKLQFKTPESEATLAEVTLPKGMLHSNPDLRTEIIYKNSLTTDLNLAFIKPNLTDLPLTIHYQGCSEQGFCYPPQVKNFNVKLDKGVITQVYPVDHTPVKEFAQKMEPAPVTPSMGLLNTAFNTQNIFTLFLGCFALGLVLCFTPCVLPMVPMLSTLIIGKQNLKTKKAFSLSAVYVLSMSLTYAIAGISAALLGQRIQTAFQSPWVLSAFAGLFVLLGLELAGHLRVSMPDFIKSRLYHLQTKSNSGTFLGAAALGILATLVASPCVSAPLMGVLGYITQTGNVVVGGLSLFAIGLGMGTPLIIAGTLGGKYLPKTGRWMQLINEIFAVSLFAFAIWILDRFAAPFIIMSLWALLSLYVAYKLGSFDLKRSGLMPRLGMLFIIGSGFMVLSLSPYGISLTQPTTQLHAFNTISSLDALEQKLQAAKGQQPTLVEFYADWCTSCKKMEKHTLGQSDVQAQLKNWNLVKANVTQNTNNEQQLLKQFELMGPPSILFFDKEGNEQPHLRLNGEVDPAKLIEHLKKIEQS